ncbi:alpha/beta hydrolase [Streptosporangium amethystogenes subsp. fukuiense]|uniref:Alpha/beta hydrolase n=1 Tax=Streptosporangium amethystogenes subsp. fukuiense TaxID=698418 RepID=A0ABW2SUL2_9ACTN
MPLAERAGRAAGSGSPARCHRCLHPGPTGRTPSGDRSRHRVCPVNELHPVIRTAEGSRFERHTHPHHARRQRRGSGGARGPAVPSPVLPADADLTPVLPHTGGISGAWVSAPRHPAGLVATETGVTVYLHGGGFEYKNPHMEQVMAYRLSRATGRPVLAVDYRLAPAHPYPAALDDLVTAYRSLLDQDVPASRIILAGESAGGTLLLSALLVLKEAGDPLPAGAVAVSPQTDLTLSSPSIDANDGQDFVNRAVLDHVRTQYLAGAQPGRAPQSPLHGELDGLPPLLLAVGSKEVMLDDARRFAEAASAAGGNVCLDIYDGMPHAFHATVLSATPLPVATTLLRRVTEWVDQRDRSQ